MDRRLVVLKRFVEALGEPANISSIDARKRFQKAVYLGQLTGVDLGYRYSWYVRGPYSSPLANDYYALSAALESDEKAPTNIILKPTAKSKLENLKSLLKVPKGVNLDESDWYEVLASWHYLLTVSKKNESSAMETMKFQKKHLVPFVKTADEKLREHDLIK